MTMIVAVLIGTGTLFIASAIECISLVDTFQKIISGKTIDWSGQTAQCANTGSNPLLPSASNKPVNPDGSCPKGYTKATDSSGLPYCVPTSSTTST